MEILLNPVVLTHVLVFALLVDFFLIMCILLYGPEFQRLAELRASRPVYRVTFENRPWLTGEQRTYRAYTERDTAGHYFNPPSNCACCSLPLNQCRQATKRGIN